MNGRLRDLFFWIHLVLGVAGSLFALLLCLTGALLAVELPVTRWADHQLVEPVDHRPELSTFVEQVRTVEGRTPLSITIGRHPRDPVRASFGRRDSVLFDPGTGASLGQGSWAHGFFRSTMFLHRWLLLDGAGREVGKQVIGVSTLAFCLLVPTGLLLWLPRRWRWKNVRAVLLLKRGATGKARDFNWHHVFGFWMALPLFFFAFTGAAIGYRSIADGVVSLVAEVPADAGGQHGPPRGGRARPGGDEPEAEEPPLGPRLVGLDAALDLALAEVSDWQRATLTLPPDSTAPVEIQVDRGNGRQAWHQQTFSVARDGSRILSRKGWADTDAERKARTWIRFGHTGELFGTLGILTAVLACLSGALLVYTGLTLTWRRFVAWRKRQARARG